MAQSLQSVRSERHLQWTIFSLCFTVLSYRLLAALAGFAVGESPLLNTTLVGTAAAIGLLAMFTNGWASPLADRRTMPPRWSTKDRAQTLPKPFVPFHAAKPLPTGETHRVLSSILHSYKSHIRSISVVGSAAYGLQREGSDTDIVIICTGRAAEAIRSAICEQEIEEALGGQTQATRAEYIVLTSEEADELFLNSSPFAYAIRYGTILQDDGCLQHLFRSRHEAAPSADYALKQLREMIIVPYYGSLRSLREAEREGRCGDACGSAELRCGSQCPVTVLATTVMRMLYVSLPLRGYMPLTKEDAVTFTAAVYGREYSALLSKIAELLRNTRTTLRSGDRRQLRSFAVRLFREIVAATGSRQATRDLLRDAAAVMRGNYQDIRDPDLQACFVSRAPELTRAA